MNIAEFSVFDDYNTKLDEILKDASYSEICNYIHLLPKPYEDLYVQGMDYVNKFYKLAYQLYSNSENTSDIEIKIQIDNQLQAVYFAYCYFDYHDITLNYKEFVTFSRILCTWFHDYNPTIKREDDNSLQIQEKWIKNIVNEVSYCSKHSPHPHAFEFDKTKLQLLLEKLNIKVSQILDSYFDKYHIMNYQQTIDEALILKNHKKEIAQYIKRRMS